MLDLAICLLLEPVHRKDRSGSLRQRCQRVLERNHQVLCLKLVLLLGGAWCVDRLVERQCGNPAASATCPVNQYIARYPVKKPAGIDEMRDLAACRSAKKDLLREIGRQVFPDARPEVVQQSVPLAAIDRLENAARREVGGSRNGAARGRRSGWIPAISPYEASIHAGIAVT